MNKRTDPFGPAEKPNTLKQKEEQNPYRRLERAGKGFLLFQLALTGPSKALR
jgi:hypothetical protein